MANFGMCHFFDQDFTYVLLALEHNSNAMVVYDHPIAPKRK